MKTLSVFFVFMLSSALASAQANCQTVMLPDLGPVGETPVTGGIATSFFVPPFADAGTFYPVVIYSDKQGNVGIWQNTGVGEKPLREFKGVTSISLVWWLSFYEAALAPIKAIGYKILPNSVTLGQLPNPTWAFRETQIFDQPIANTNLSLPVQLGEVWNVGIENPYREPIRYNLQIESRICQ